MHAPMKESPQRRIGMMIRTLVWIKGENDAGRMKLGILMRDKWLCEPVKGCDSEAGDSENARVSWGGVLRTSLLLGHTDDRQPREE
jgi:hypothetical protein